MYVECQYQIGFTVEHGRSDELGSRGGLEKIVVLINRKISAVFLQTA